jgi:hypothetical protein
MTEEANAAVWYWLRPDRQQVQGSFKELTALLSARALPRSTMVWLDPWPEWRPAHRVPELAAFLPAGATRASKRPEAAGATKEPTGDAKEPTAIAKESGEAKEPIESAKKPSGDAKDSAADVKDFAVHAKEASSTSDANATTVSTAVLPAASPVEKPRAPATEIKIPRPDPPRPSTQAARLDAGVASSVRPASVPPPRAATTSPPLAVTATPVEPSRAPANEAVIEAAPNAAELTVTPLSSTANEVQEATRHEVSPAPAAASEFVKTARLPDVVPLPPLPSPVWSEPAPTGPVTLEGALRHFPEHSTYEAPRVSGSSEAPVELATESASLGGDKSRGLRIAVAATAAVCGALAIALAFSLQALATRRAPVAALQPAPNAVSVPGCTMLTAPARLYESVERDVMPTLVELDANRVAIGFAGARTEARGVVVRLDTLDSKSTFSEPGERAVVGVLASGPDGKFTVDRDDSAFVSAASFDAPRHGVLGVDKDDHVVRQFAEQAPASLWTLAKNPITVPRIARFEGGSVVALRAGGASGNLGLGWLDADGAAAGDFQLLEPGVRFFGSPAVAANNGAALVAFAGRDSEAEPWRIRLGRAAARSAVTSVIDFPISGDELGAGAIAPALTAFDKNGWLLQWTEGNVGRLRVRVQMLSEALRPVGEPLLVSPMGANAGQGSVWVLGDRVLSLFLLPVPGRDELWGSVLRCQ